MARKQPIGYEVRRPLTLWGRKREIGEFLPREEVASVMRIESLVRSGRFLAVYDETDLGYVARGHHGKRKDIISDPDAHKTVDEPVVKVVDEAVDEPVETVEKPKRGRPKKAVEGEK